VAYAFSLYMVAWMYHPHALAAAFVPGVVLGLVLVRHGERGGLAGLVACGVGVATAGHPETLAHAALAGAAVAAALLARPAALARRRFLLRLAAAALLAFCLAAPALLPIVEALPDSERREVLRRAPRSVDPPPFAPRQALVLAAPLAFGSPRDDDWHGPTNFNELCSGYAGLLAVALALAGALTLPRLYGPLVLGVAALLPAFGVGPALALLKALPVLGLGAHGRLRLLWVLAVAVVAGLAVERLPATRRGRAVTIGLLVALGLLGAATTPASGTTQRLWLAGALGGAAVAAAALALPVARPRFAPLAVGLLAAELFAIGVRYQPSLPAVFDLAPPPALRFLVERRAAEPPFRVLAYGHDLLPNLAAFYGLSDARAYDPMRPAAASEVVARRRRRPFRLPMLNRGEPGWDPSMFDYVAARYLLAPPGRRPGPPWRPAFRGAGGTVWRNPRALPLFFVPRRVTALPDRAAALAQVRAVEDFAALAVVEGAGTAAGQSGTVAVRAVRANGFDLDARCAGDCLVASSVSWAPAWRARRGDRPLATRRVNAGFLGVVAPAGESRIELDYAPAGWRRGWALCGGAVAVWAGAALVRRRRGLAPW
jgi:hypothetical protein